MLWRIGLAWCNLKKVYKQDYQFSDCSQSRKRRYQRRIKKVINKTANSAIAQKVTNAVVKGAASATQKAVENKVTDLLKRKAPSTTGSGCGGKTNKKN